MTLTKKNKRKKNLFPTKKDYSLLKKKIVKIQRRSMQLKMESLFGTSNFSSLLFSSIRDIN